MKDKLADLRLEHDEVYSLIVVLQSAIQYQDNGLTLTDIDNSLEILKNKYEKMIKNFETIFES